MEEEEENIHREVHCWQQYQQLRDPEEAHWLGGWDESGQDGAGLEPACDKHSLISRALPCSHSTLPRWFGNSTVVSVNNVNKESHCPPSSQETREEMKGQTVTNVSGKWWFLTWCSHTPTLCFSVSDQYLLKGHLLGQHWNTWNLGENKTSHECFVQKTLWTISTHLL